jgi:hypothetical protein
MRADRRAGLVAGLVALLACSVLSPVLSSQDALGPNDILLRHEFFCERSVPPEADPAVREFKGLPASPGLDASPGAALALSDAEIAERLRAEAEWSYLGMIYGFDVSYVPLDRARGVAESYSVVPAWESRRHLPGLALRQMEWQGDILRAYVEYTMDKAQLSRYLGWRRADTVPFQAEGAAGASGGGTMRMKAMEEAVKTALREYARTLTRNKPSQVKAIVALERPPDVFYREGSYVARVRVRIKVLELRPYAVY